MVKRSGSRTANTAVRLNVEELDMIDRVRSYVLAQSIAGTTVTVSDVLRICLHVYDREISAHKPMLR